MDKLVKVTKTPVIYTKIEHEGCETIYNEAVGTILHYENGKIVKGEPQYGKFYRKVDESYKDQENVKSIVTVDPADFNMTRHYFQEIVLEE